MSIPNDGYVGDGGLAGGADDADVGVDPVIGDVEPTPCEGPVDVGVGLVVVVRPVPPELLGELLAPDDSAVPAPVDVDPEFGPVVGRGFGD